MNERRIQDLLLKWEEEYEHGRDIPPEELCRAEPELAKELAIRIAALKQMKWLDHGESESSASADGLAQRENAAVGETAVIAGRYRLENVVGEGAFGIVWRGFDLHLQRPVAIKIPKKGHSPRKAQVEQFLEEARRLARLSRTGIVPVYDVIGYQGSYAIISEFIEGVNLSTYLIGRSLPVWEAVSFVAALARQFEHSHRNGIVHRDIKPANILVNHQNELFVTDFGVATTLDPGGRPSKKDRCGTIPYMAPELFPPLSSGADARSDVYSLGVVLYQLLTGLLPYTASNSSQLRDAILNDKIVPPGQLRQLPDKLNTICMKCLARDPNDRYQSMEELSADLLEYPTPYHFLLPGPIWVSVLLLLGVSGISVATLWGAFHFSPFLTSLLWLLNISLGFFVGKTIGFGAKNNDLHLILNENLLPASKSERKDFSITEVYALAKMANGNSSFVSDESALRPLIDKSQNEAKTDNAKLASVGALATTPPSEEELRAFVGNNADYYLERWQKKVDNPGTRSGFNFSAFFVGPIWLTYRLMFKATFIVCGISFITDGLMRFYFVEDLGMLRVPRSVEGGTMLIFAIVCGIWGNDWYFAHARREIENMRKQGLGKKAHLIALMNNGGSNFAVAIGFWMVLVLVMVSLRHIVAEMKSDVGLWRYVSLLFT